MAQERKRTPRGVATVVPSNWRKVARFGTLALLLSSVLVPLDRAQRRPMRRAGREDGDIIRRRQEWFFKQRAYPLGFIPAGARARALQQLEEMRKREAAEGAPSLTAKPAAAGTNVSTPAWTAIGPQPTNSPFATPFTSGRVTALAVDPCDGSGKTVYLGGAEGGVWKTTDGGTTWTPLTDFQPSLATGSIGLDTSSCTGTPAHANAIYVGTGEEDFSGDSYYGAGVLKSTDGGATWAAFGTSAFAGTVSPITQYAGGPWIGAIGVDPANSSILLCAVQGFGSSFDDGIWRSTDGGNSWTHVLPTTAFNNIFATDLVFDPADKTGKTVYAALGDLVGTSKSGVYKSTDSGTTWTSLTIPGFSGLNFGRISLAIGPPISGSTTGVLFTAIADASTFSSGLLGVFKSTNGGTTWTQLTAPAVTPSGGFCNFQCWYDMAIRVSPTNPSLVFVGGAAGNSLAVETVFRSTDGGNTWADVSASGSGSTLHVDTHAFAFSADGKSLYVGNDGGAWSSTDVVNTATLAGSQHWTNLNSALNITEFYPGHSIHPSNPRISVGGTQDNGLQKHEDDLTMSVPDLAWDDLGVPCDGGFTAVDTKIPSTVYGTCEYIPNFLLIIGVSYVGGDLSGNNGLLVTSGIDGTDRGAFIPPLVMDPSNPQSLYFGTFRVWQTTNGAISWSAISPDLSFAGGGVLTALAVAPSDSNTIYAGTDDAQVQVTTNGGGIWTNISNTFGPGGLPDRVVTQVAADPKLSTTAYVTFSGFSGFLGGDTRGHVFKTADGGTTWTDISCTASNCGTPNPTDLPNIPVNDLVVDPDIPNTLYVATDIGVFQTSNGGATWSTLGADSLPRVVVLSLKLQEASRTLRAATHGRGVWDLALANQAAFGITGISPALAHAGDSGTTLTADGNGFTASSVVQWNGSPRTTSFVGSSQLTAVITASDLAAGAAVPVTVTDPGQPNPSNTLVFTVLNPAPSLLSISPTSATAGANSATLTVTGGNFVSSTAVQFNGTNVSTTLNNSTTLTATIPASDLTVGQLATIDVFTAQPGGGPDFNPQSFTVVNPVPAITSLSPPTANGGTSGFTLAVSGSNFNPSSSVKWNGSPRTTAFVNSTQLTASIASSDLLNPGSFPVTVFNPTPGGGTSNSVTFTVSAVDFAFGTPSPATQTVTAGTSAKYTIPISPAGAGATAVTLACSNLPASSSCSISPNPVTPVSGGSNAVVTISTIARTVLPGAPFGRRRPFSPRGIWLTLALAVFVAAILLMNRTSGRPRLALGLVFGLVVLGFTLVGCGGGGGGGGGSSGTPPGTFMVTVTGTSGTFQHSTTLTLVVQ